VRVTLGAIAEVSIIEGGVTADVEDAGADAQANTLNALWVAGRLMTWNGATWDRVYSAGTDRDAIAEAAGFHLQQIGFGHAYNGATWDRLRSEGTDRDGIAAASLGHLQSIGFGHLWNGASWDRRRANHPVTILASNGRSSTTTSADLTNYNARGAALYLKVTSVPGVDTVQLEIEAKDPESGDYWSMAAGTAGAGLRTEDWVVYPGATQPGARVDQLVGLPLPRTWRVKIVHSGVGEFFYSVGAEMIL